MNNRNKKANIMTWKTFKKKFNPILYSATDNVFGTKSVIEPTMRKIGFNVNYIWDVDEKVNPRDIINENIDVYSATYIIYHPFKYRDGSGKAIAIFTDKYAKFTNFEETYENTPHKITQ